MSHTTNGLLGVVSAGTPRDVPFTELFLVLPLSWGLHWHSDWCVWQRPGLPHLCQISIPLLYFKSAILDARCGKVSADLSSGLALGI